MTANFVAREAGWRIDDWGEGDRSTQAAFRDPATYEARFGDLLDEAVALGFRAVDVWDGHLNAEWVTDEQIATARRLLDARGLRVASLAGWFGSTPERFERTCEIAAALGAPILGGGTSLLTTARAALVAGLERHDLRLAIENHPKERTPDDMLAEIGDGGNGRIGTTVDTGWWGTQGVDAADAIRALAPHVMHVHLKDVRAVGEPHETCRFGEGVVPIRRCVEALGEIGYDGAISVEHEPYDRDPRREIEQNLGDLRSWLAGEASS
ncbi:MAG TPA: sugar phosphate isomerase/epimerase family protein [Candidatus Limnocylindrales bacterium]|nr:sugar phosphate isomerase/epimerase family protein [Candidatus Limnocylindrales bacterium]